MKSLELIKENLFGIYKDSDLNKKENILVHSAGVEKVEVWNYFIAIETFKFLGSRAETSIESIFEFSLASNEVSPPHWPLELLDRIEKYIEDTQVNFKEGDIIDIESFENTDNIYSFIVIEGDTIHNIDCSKEDFTIFKIIGITKEEYNFAQIMGSRELIKKIKDLEHYTITNPKRNCTVKLTDKNHNYWFEELELSKEKDDLFELCVGLGDLLALEDNPFNKIDSKTKINISSYDLEVSIELGGRFEIEEKDGLVKIILPESTLDFLKNKLRSRVQRLKIPECEGLVLNIRKTYLKNTCGEIIGIID